MKRLSDDFIIALRERLDIVELISSYLKLKKTGVNYSACCPFHSEKSPSFSVSPQKQFYHCFGCGAHGDAIAFVQNYEHIGFMDAVEKLSATVGLTIQKEPEQHEELHAVLSAAQDFYTQALKTSPEAIAYFKKRGLTGQTAKHYGLGWAPSGWDVLKNHLRQKGFSEQAMQEAGLLGAKGFDLFRSRVMFPIRSYSGSVLGFGGRVLGDEQPKYLNSPETKVFHKKYCLFGRFEHKTLFDHTLPIVVVEGYMDVIGLAQHGFYNAVATLGTAITDAHVEKLLKITSNIVMAFDGDLAGKKAAVKALKIILPLLTGPFNIRFLTLPAGEDPDSIIRKNGKDAWMELLKTALPLSEFVFDLSKELYPGVGIEEKARRQAFVRKVVHTLPEGDYKMVFKNEMGASMYTRAPAYSYAYKPVERPKVVDLKDQLALMLSVEPLLAELLEGKSLPGHIEEIIQSSQKGTLVFPEALKGSTLQKYFEAMDEDARVQNFNELINKLTKQKIGQELDLLLQKAKTETLSSAEKLRLKEALQEKG